MNSKLLARHTLRLSLSRSSQMRVPIRTAGLVGLSVLAISACSSDADQSSDTGADYSLESSDTHVPSHSDESSSLHEDQSDERAIDPVVVERLAVRRGISYEEARERASWQQHLGDLNTRATDSFGEGFAGVWVDVNDGDRIKISVASSRIGDLARIQKVLDASKIAQAVDIVEARYSVAELDAVHLALSDRMLETEEPLPGLSVGLRTDLNAIQIGIPSEGMATGHLAFVDAAVEEYGDMVVVEPASTPKPTGGTCSGNGCSTVLHGGQRITGCTAGFLAGSGSRRFVFTAGHCIVNGGTSSGRDAGGNMLTIGPNYRAIYGLNNLRTSHINRDIGIIELTSSNWTADNIVIRYVGDASYSHSHTISQEGGSSVGSQICMSGATTQATDCGSIIAVNVTFTDTAGALINQAGWANYCPAPGDSGAPMFNGSTALGINTHFSTDSSGNCTGYYQGIIEAENLMQVRVLH